MIQPSDSGTALLIDGNNCAFRAFYAHSGLNTQQGEGSGCIYGMLKMIFNFRRNFPDSHIIVFWDHGKSAWRQALYPNYKAQRLERDAQAQAAYDEAQRQMQEIRVACELLGLPQISTKNVEADDLISIAARALTHKRYNCKVYIVSTDKDFLQLLGPRIKIFREPDDNAPLSFKWFVQQYRITPSQWPDVRALMGDHSDNIPGAKGIGEVRALNIVQEYGGLEGLKDCLVASLFPKTKMTFDRYAQVAIEHMDELLTFLELIRLPVDVYDKHFDKKTIERIKDAMVDLTMHEPRKHTLNEFRKFCIRYDLESFLKNIVVWQEHFKLRR